MQILTGTQPTQTLARAPRAQAAPSVAVETPADSVTLSSSFASDMGKVGFVGLASATPLVGAVSNFAAMIGAGVSNRQGLAYANLAAAGANVVGTGALITSFFTGSSTATNIGLGLLGASGLAGGVTAYVLAQD
jgi:hypothetical protein